MKWHNQWARYRAQDADGNWFEYQNEPEYDNGYGKWHTLGRLRYTGSSAVIVGHAANTLEVRP